MYSHRAYLLVVRCMSYKKILSRDPILAWVINQLDPLTDIVASQDIYKDLLETIVSQQLSVKVADVIRKRFLQLFQDGYPHATQIINYPLEQLRAVWLSNSKAQYLKNIALYWQEHKLTQSGLLKLSDDTLWSLLLAIKGVGPWTVEMMLMFSVWREDIFSVWDLGIQTAMINLYNLDPSQPKQLKQDMIRISDNRKPYRSYACRYLRKWKDRKKS